MGFDDAPDPLCYHSKGINQTNLGEERISSLEASLRGHDIRAFRRRSKKSLLRGAIGAWA